MKEIKKETAQEQPETRQAILEKRVSFLEKENIFLIHKINNFLTYLMVYVVIMFITLILCIFILLKM